MSEGNGYADRATFLAPAQRRFKDVWLPVGGHKLRLQSLMEGEKEAYESSMLNSKSGGLRMDRVKRARRELISRCLVKQDGTLLLGTEDVDALMKLDGADMAFLQEECQTFCGFKQGDIEGLVKNSEAAHVSD